MQAPQTAPIRGMSDAFVAHFLESSRPVPPPPDLPGERVGNEIAELRKQLAHADRYSAAEIDAMRSALVALNQERAQEELKPTGGGTYDTEKLTFRAKVARDGSVALEDIPENMDSQDRMMLRMGIDPYLHNKLAFLDRTRDQRVAIGRRYRAEQLSHSAELARDNVARLWASTGDLAARKQALFEMWDECLEAGEQEEIDGGAAARAYVMAFIRAKLPGAYTADELAALNARRTSKEVFAP